MKDWVGLLQLVCLLHLESALILMNQEKRKLTINNYIMAGDDKKKKWTQGKEFVRSQQDGYDTYTPKGDHTDFAIVGVGDKRKIAPLGYNLQGQDLNGLPDLDTDSYENNLSMLKDLNDKV